GWGTDRNPRVSSPSARRGAPWGTSAQRRYGACVSAPLRADHAHERDALARRAAEVVGERELAPARDAGDLPLAGLAAQLQPALEQHPKTGGADGVAEGLEPTVGIDGQLALEVEGAGQDFLPSRAARRE